MKQYADMHVHSTFSIDGISKMEDYCVIANERNVGYICFTEHVDFNSAEKNLSTTNDNRLSNFDVSKYFDEINRLREKYRSIHILSGIEFSEPHLFPSEFANYCSMPFDCITAGIHHCYNSVFPGAGNLPETQAVFEYYDIMLKTVKFAGFQVLAHFDFPRIFFDNWIVDEETIETIFKTILENDIILEINTSSINGKCNDPFPIYSIIDKYNRLSSRDNREFIIAKQN